MPCLPGQPPSRPHCGLFRIELIADYSEHAGTTPWSLQDGDMCSGEVDARNPWLCDISLRLVYMSPDVNPLALMHVHANAIAPPVTLACFLHPGGLRISTSPGGHEDEVDFPGGLVETPVSRSTSTAFKRRGATTTLVAIVRAKPMRAALHCLVILCTMVECLRRIGSVLVDLDEQSSRCCQAGCFHNLDTQRRRQGTKDSHNRRCSSTTPPRRLSAARDRHCGGQTAIKSSLSVSLTESATNFCDQLLRLIHDHFKSASCRQSNEISIPHAHSRRQSSARPRFHALPPTAAKPTTTTHSISSFRRSSTALPWSMRS